MRLYKFIGERYVYESLLFKRIKVSKPSEVNDPFELCPFAFSTRWDRHVWRKAMTSVESRIGFISFSSSWESPALWGNYANNHRGACLEFEAPLDLYNLPGRDPELLQVSYEEKLTAFDSKTYQDPSMLTEKLRYAVATKSSHWSYESEWRLLVDLEESPNTDGVNFKSFDERLKLSRVILGFRSNLTAEDARIAFGGSLR